MNALLLALLFLSLSFMTFAQLSDWGAISVDDLGTKTSSYHIGGGNGGVTVSGNSIKLSQQYQPRVYLTSNGQYFRFPNMLGKTIQFDINLGSTTCGCNAAVYFVQLPVGSAPGYYADAQTPKPNTCTEIDVMEANTQALQTTLHTNTGDNPGQWGCGVNWKSAQGYGAGPSNKINSLNPFTVHMSFVGGSTLTAVNVKLSQGSNSLTYQITDSTCTVASGYLDRLSSAITSGELVLAISFWSGSMSWLDGCSYNGCTSSMSASFSNIQFYSGAAALTEDNSATSPSNFVGTSGFYAVIGITVIVVVLALIVALVVHKKRQNAEIV